MVKIPKTNRKGDFYEGKKDYRDCNFGAYVYLRSVNRRYCEGKQGCFKRVRKPGLRYAPKRLKYSF